MPFVSYVQNAEDVVLWRVLRTLRPGAYVDVGAADPVADSVTHAFYLRGWRGVNVEPVPALAERLREVRSGDTTVEAVAGAAAGSVEFFVTEGTGRLTAVVVVADETARDGLEVRSIQRDVRTLDDIIASAPPMDRELHFLKIDVEGFEAEVLVGLDLRRWRPWVLIIEATAPQSTSRTDDEWDQQVRAAGYERGLFDGLNRFYAATERSDLLPLLSYPACVFDQPYLRSDIQAQLQRFESEVANRELAIANLEERAAASDAVVGGLRTPCS